MNNIQMKRRGVNAIWVLPLALLVGCATQTSLTPNSNLNASNYDANLQLEQRLELQRALPFYDRDIDLYNQGLQAYDIGDYQDAYAIWEGLAEEGNAIAQFNIAHMHEVGEGVEKNAVEALKWYQRAAGQGYAEAQNNLGILYSNGIGAPRDQKQSAYWTEMAANQGLPNAQFQMGVKHNTGRGVDKDDRKAFEWFLKSASSGFPAAQTITAEYYLSGKGVQQDINLALYWFQQAAEQDFPQAQYSLGVLYQ
ncbi:MAG: tetratricopeptide repeat protein, partial [Gammaproteobacteria bacterium]